MHWLSFLIGALAGWLIGWLIDYLICRPRRAAAEALLNAKLERCDGESASLRAQLTGYQDLQARLDGANAEVDALKAQLSGMKNLQADLITWKAQSTQQALEIERLNAELAARVSTGTAAAAAGAVAAADAAIAGGPETGVEAFAVPAPETDIAPTPPAVQAVEPDDLARIEGIGPKISAMLNQNGVYTFAQLAATSVERLQSILSSGGPRFRLADPQTWPEQAQFARDGKWDELQAFQDTLKAGRVV